MWTRRSRAGIARPENQRMAGSEPKRPTTTTTRNDTDRDNMGQLALSKLCFATGKHLDTGYPKVSHSWHLATASSFLSSCRVYPFVLKASRFFVVGCVTRSFTLAGWQFSIVSCDTWVQLVDITWVCDVCEYLDLRAGRSGKLVIGDAAANDIDSWCEILRQLESQSEG